MNKRWAGVMGALCGAIWAGAAAYAAEAAKPELAIAADGKSGYSIVIPNGPDERNRVKNASDLLQSVLAEATGAKLPVVKEGEFKADTPALYLGRTEAAEKAGLPLNELKGWTFIKEVRGKDVFLAGLDAAAGVAGDSSIEYLGTLKAVTSFLEDEAGVRFVLPGPNGLSVPKLKQLSIPADLKVLRRPNFEWVIGRTPNDTTYSVANNYFWMSCAVKSYGGHSYYDAVPEKTYFKDHPEYFAFHNGVRSGAGNHLCISNPDVQKLMIQEMEKWFDRGYEGVELSQTDGYEPCECDACKAINPNPSERLWIVHRKLAEQMKTLRPGKKVMINSYGPTTHPPKTFNDFPDNVIIQMSHYEPESFDEWSRFHVDKTVYIYDWGLYWPPGLGPKRTPQYVADQVKRFVQNKVRGIYMCGCFENLGLEGPVYYTFGKCMGNPTLSPTNDDYRAAQAAGDFMKAIHLFEKGRPEADDYYRAAFGEARAPMKAFFDACYARLEFFSLVNGRNFRTEAPPAPGLDTPADFYCFFFPAPLLTDMEQNLRRAKGMDKNPRVQARLKLVEAYFGYVNNLARMFQFYRAYRLAPNWKTFDLLAAEVDKRNAMIDSLYDEKGSFREDGWPIKWGSMSKEYLRVGGYMYAALGAPANWDTKLLREKQVLPGVGSKTLKISKVAGIAPDGKLRSPGWQGVKGDEFAEIGMGALKNGTTFKMAYDDKNLYFAFECALDTADQLMIPKYGRDGPVWRSECIEIFLDPFGRREKYYHFIFNPVPNSCYDSRIGFITDPLDPLFGQDDPSWDGDWEYWAQIDKAGKRWTAEVKIPFKTLGVEPPQPGTTWHMNVGRESPAAEERMQAEFSLWSPNLEDRNMESATAFGDLVFE